MKRILPGILLVVLGCAEAEIPPIELSGGGARLMNGKAENAYDAYDMAYTNLSKQHYNVRRNLETRGRNAYAARVAMERIVAHLTNMQSLVTPDYHEAMAPYIARYAKWVEDVRRGTWGGSYMSDFNRSEREIRSKFSPHKVTFATSAPVAAPATAQAPAAPAPAVAPTAAPKALPSDRAELPKVTAPAPKPQPKSPAAPAPAPAAKPALSFRLAFLAWTSAHDRLVEAYTAKKGCSENYNDVTEAIGHLKAAAKGGQVAKLQIYAEYYQQIHEKTKGFTTLPEKTSHQDITDELAVAARVIRKEFNPDK